MGMPLEMPLKASADHVPSCVVMKLTCLSFLRGPEGTSANGKTEQSGGQGGADRWSSLQQWDFYLSNSSEIILGKIISTKQGTTSSFFSATELVFSGLLSYFFLPFPSVNLPLSAIVHTLLYNFTWSSGLWSVSHIGPFLCTVKLLPTWPLSSTRFGICQGCSVARDLILVPRYSHISIHEFL